MQPHVDLLLLHASMWKKTSVIFICKLDIIRKEYVIWLQIFSAAVLPNIIKIGPQLTK